MFTFNFLLNNVYNFSLREVTLKLSFKIYGRVIKNRLRHVKIHKNTIFYLFLIQSPSKKKIIISAVFDLAVKMSEKLSFITINIQYTCT